MNKIKVLSDWIRTQCEDEGWQHDTGLEIKTLDNPGWEVHIVLPYEKEFYLVPLDINNGDNDWVFSRIEDGSYAAYGDLSKLEVMIDNFLASVQLTGVEGLATRSVG